MTRAPFRFRPPPIASTPELRWVLASAFGPPARPISTELTDPAAAVDLAARLALLPRLAARLQSETLVRDAGLAERLRAERVRCNASELRLDESLAEAAGIAAGLGVGIALLKGRALTLGGYAAPGARPSGDIDLLVPASGLEALRRELRRRGFVETAGTGYEHHSPILRRPGGANLELHRHLPGVRLDGRRSAKWESLESAGLLKPLPAGSAIAGLRLPARAVLVAHALVHALAQHGLSTSYSGWLLIGDLVDLEAREIAGGPWRQWIARDLAAEEIDAALELARIVAASGDPFREDESSRARTLAAHFVACALDPDYGQALKARWLEAPVSDYSRLGARLRLILRTLSPPARDSTAIESAGALSRTASWIARPFALAGKAVRAAGARRRVETARQRRENRDDRG